MAHAGAPPVVATSPRSCPEATRSLSLPFAAGCLLLPAEPQSRCTTPRTRPVASEPRLSSSASGRCHTVRALGGVGSRLVDREPGRRVLARDGVGLTRTPASRSRGTLRRALATSNSRPSGSVLAAIPSGCVPRRAVPFHIDFRASSWAGSGPCSLRSARRPPDERDDDDGADTDEWNTFRPPVPPVGNSPISGRSNLSASGPFRSRRRGT